MKNVFAKAKWIWQKDNAEKDEFCDFLSEFTTEKKSDGKYFLKIAADSNYTVRINGRIAAFGQYSDYPDYKVYDRVDVTKFVENGKNRVAVTVWYYGIDTQTYIVGDAGVIYEITDGTGSVLAATGEETLSRKSKDYISGREDMISAQLGLTYHYDMTGFDDFITKNNDGFEKSRLVLTISTDFNLRPNKKLVLKERMPSKIISAGHFTYPDTDENACMKMQYAALTYRNLADFGIPTLNSFIQQQKNDVARLEMTKESSEDGLYFIVDLGEETSGFLDIDIEVEEECLLEVGYGEHLKEGRCRTAIRGFWCDVKLKKGRNEYLHTFRRFGCRYLQFFLHTRKATVNYAGIRPTEYPLRWKNYKSGNLLRDTVYKVCQNTLQQCLHEHYEDCPWREQALYTMDSRNQMLCGYFAFGEKKAARASLELISHGVRGDGLLTLCYPAGRDYPIPAFSCMYFVQMEEYIRYTGDTSLAKSKLEMLEKLIDVFLRKMQPEGVIENFYGEYDGQSVYWNYYEWSPNLFGAFGTNEKRLEAPINAFLSLALQSLSKICNALGEKQKAKKYIETAKKLNKAIENVFFNDETKLFENFEKDLRGEYSTLTQSLCMLCGAAKDVDTSVMLKVMESNGRADVGVKTFPNSLSMNAFRFDALLAKNKKKYAPIILEELDREYLSMLRKGATTFWETVDGEDDFDNAGSLCHGWSALPIYYYELLNE